MQEKRYKRWLSSLPAKQAYQIVRETMGATNIMQADVLGEFCQKNASIWSFLQRKYDLASSVSITKGHLSNEEEKSNSSSKGTGKWSSEWNGKGSSIRNEERIIRESNGQSTRWSIGGSCRWSTRKECDKK